MRRLGGAGPRIGHAGPDRRTRRSPPRCEEARPPGAGSSPDAHPGGGDVQLGRRVRPGHRAGHRPRINSSELRRRPTRSGCDRRACPADDGIERASAADGGATVAPEAGPDQGLGARPHRPLALLQPRALLARLQRPGPAARRGPARAAAGAGQLLRDLRGQPRRVLHGAGRGPARPGRGKIDARGADGMAAADVIAADPPASDRPASGSRRCFEEEIQPALAEHGIRIISLGCRQRGGARGAGAAVPRARSSRP